MEKKSPPPGRPKKTAPAAEGLSALSTEDLEKLIAEVLADQTVDAR